MAKYYDKKTKQWVEGDGGSMFPFFGFTSPKFNQLQEEYKNRGGITQDFEIVSPDDLMYMEGGGIADLEKDKKKSSRTGMEGSPELPSNKKGSKESAKEDSLNDFEIKMKKKPKVPEPKEETETKTGKDYGELGFFQKLLKAATENPEATLALGRALLKGEGLGIGLSDFAEEKIAQDKAQAALDVAAEEKAYDRKMQEAKFNLDVMKAEDLAKYYDQMGYAAVAKSDRPLKEIEYGIKYAQFQRDENGQPLKVGSAEFDAKVLEGMQLYGDSGSSFLEKMLGITNPAEEAVAAASVGSNDIPVSYENLSGYNK